MGESGIATRSKVKAALVICLLGLLALSSPWLVFARRPQILSWSPNQPVTNAQYVGSDACAQCHRSKATTQSASAMAHAMVDAAGARILRDNPQLLFQDGRWNYRIHRTGERSIYTVTDGKETLTTPILWAFGRGVSGQTYVIRHEGVYYETRVSFFTKLKALDFTPGAPRHDAEKLADAIGQSLSPAVAQSCFGCHATVAPGAPRFDVERFSPGVRCETCHGPGEKHIATMKTGKPVEEKLIFNPRRMNPDDMSQQFCGACHRSWETVMQMPERGGLSNIRFQPYRLANSACYQKPDDPRLRCTACHDPHEDPRHDAAFYDAKCLACHLSKDKTDPAGADRTAKACQVGVSGCARCHMPKIEPPDLHFKFTDHHIRIVRPNESTPR